MGLVDVYDNAQLLSFKRLGMDDYGLADSNN